jgi:hypothetical protein
MMHHGTPTQWQSIDQKQEEKMKIANGKTYYAL